MVNYLNAILLVIVLGSGFAVVTVKYQSSQYNIELGKLENQKAQLERDYQRMTLMQTKLANLQLIQKAAKANHLQAPAIDHTKIISHHF